ncbi:MAG: hypothetical protein LUI01_07930 [Firmicutes bacterium]|nr:hypothetical protein [Bacillota bacterium]
MRETIPFNQGWSFRLEDEDTPRAVTLPHDWSVEYDLSEASPTGGGEDTRRLASAYMKPSFHAQPQTK